jgi:hypothetical protein
MGIDHDLVRQAALLGQGYQVIRAFHGDVEPGRHTVPDASAGMVSFAAGIGQVIFFLDIPLFLYNIL